MQILFILIIGIYIYSVVRKAREKVDAKDSSRQTPPLPPVVTSAPPRQNTPPVNRKPMPQKAPQKTLQKSAIEEAKEDGNSTTAYLMEKAEADAKEHAREKYEEQKRLHETRGGLPVAERHFEGDPFPQGKQCVKCGYCGAENLLPMTPRTRYSCYFCREAL
ncbi:MAG: hypothetical protein NC302_01740 [Bacteroidales bacterium]|nr:hypothetical protein [Bacteroidales bacterium]MCM1416258.1 hypothetical protein [bacterium]MCM1422386.1 hypothetical protein [bacterium]